MQEADLGTYLAESISGYADDKVKAGSWSPEEALERSRGEFRRYLPEGVNSPGQHLYCIVDTGQDVTVGMLWFGVMQDSPRPYAFLYELRIFEPFQDQGYGKRAMLALEAEVKAMGLDTISLHVFGHNPAARALYDRLGYEVTDLNMSKKL